MGPATYAGADGIHLAAEVETACDVLFDGRRVFSLAPSDGRPEASGTRLLAWPAPLRPFLVGGARVGVREHQTSTLLWEDEVRFGDDGPAGTDPRARVSIVDAQGEPLVMTKWGLLERSFDLGRPDEIERLFDQTQRLLHDLNEVIGVPAFIAYGTLLGAVRSGRAIGHDNDADIAYLSRHHHPADIATESFGIQRRLRHLGWRVDRSRHAKFGAWEVAGRGIGGGPDGLGHIDVFVAYYLAGEFNLDQWISGDFGRDRLLPLRELVMEGRALPAPADPAGLLALTYGTSWAVPDPAFRYPPEIRRVTGWFAASRVRVNSWTRWYAQAGHPATAEASDFARWVRPRLTAGSLLIDAGCGMGADTRLLAAAAPGSPQVMGFDYCPAAVDLARLGLEKTSNPVGTSNPSNMSNPADTRQPVGPRFALLSLQDGRASLAQATRFAIEPGRKTLYARLLLDVLDRGGRDNFWRFMRVLMARGGTTFLEFRAEPGQPLERPIGNAWRDVADVADVRAQLVARGGTVTEEARVPRDETREPARPALHRMMARFD